MAVVVCSSCGKYSYESGVCPFCGSKSLRRVYQPDVQGSGYLPVLKERIISIVERRGTTDKNISTFWAIAPGFRLLPLWGVFVVILVADVFDLHASVAGHRLEVSYLWLRAFSAVLFTVLTGWLVFRLINRLNEHMAREQELRKYVMDFVRATAKPANKEQEIINELIQLSAFDGQSVSYERRHNAVLWGLGISVLLLVSTLGAISELASSLSSHEPFFIGWFWLLYENFLSTSSVIAYVLLLYLGSSLVRSVYTHEVRWKGFANSVVLALNKLGLGSRISREYYQLRERSTPLYIFLTIITLGFFGFYWLYVLIEDPNIHFDSHRDFERGLVQLMRARASRGSNDREE